MRCSDVRDLLHPFLDGELEVDKNVGVLKHFEMCPACRTRSESEQQLRDLVERSATESLSDADRQRLIQGALTEEHDRWEPSQPSRWRRVGRVLAAAAAVFLAAGLYIVQADPFCWWGCPTFEAISLAQGIVDEDPLPLSQVEARIHRRIQAPELVGSEVLGANYLSAAGLPAQPVVRYRLEQGQVCYFSIPAGHSHVGESRRLVDGREYVVLEMGGLRFVGWFSEDGGTLQGCMPCDELPAEELYLAAAALRLASSS